MRVLLDTCVLSELQSKHAHESVVRTVRRIPDDDLFISVISIGEITKGIELLQNGKRKQALRDWVQSLEYSYTKRILPVDLETARVWGEITAAGQKAGYIIPVSDGLIAATARRHGLHVMTRNTKDFEPAGAMMLNPWTDA